MSSFVSITELDAAKALLELQFFSYGNKETFDGQNIEQPTIARIFGTFISSPVTDFSTITSTPKPKPFLAKWRNSTEKIVNNNMKTKNKYEIDTQTESIPVLIKKGEDMIKQLTEENLALRKKIQMLKERRSTTNSLSERYSESSKEDSSESLQRCNRQYKSFNNSRSSSHDDTTISNGKEFNSWQKDTSNSKARMKNLSGDVVPIGDGNAIVPARLLKYMDWSCHSNATRKLLTAVFPRQVLATHSLTGKPSPAFPNKPAKKKLDAALVNDIVQTIVERCGVPENVVRTSITTKCADESKMLRTRQQPKQKNKNYQKENLPPSDDSEISEELYLST